MSEKNENAKDATVSSTGSWSNIWLIPFVAAVIGGWMVWQAWANQGPLITISFETAEGMEVDTTKIKLRDITIGKVVDLELSENFKNIILTARMQKDTEDLLTAETQFWVVKPRVGRGGVSGLTTILSGAYIELSPGSQGELKTHFKGKEQPPVTPAGTPGLHITLDSAGQRALDIGDPILYKGIEVGQIEFVHFNQSERVVYYNAFIQSPYDKLITENTRFWEVNGIEIDLSADGIKVHTGTLETMLGGGVAFDVPTNLPRGNVITERAFFTIYPNKEEVHDQQYQNAQEFVLLFSQSIRGLKTGAPIEYKGIRVGSVVRTDINYPEMGNLLNKNTLIPVMVNIEPARIGLKDEEEELEKVKNNLSNWIENGLHAFMSTGNLLTGSKFIDLRYVEDTSNTVKTFNQFQVIPTTASEMDSLIEKFNSVLSKIEKVPLEDVVDNANAALVSANDTIKQLGQASEEISHMLQQPESQHLIKNVNQALKSISGLADGYSSGSTTQKDIKRMINALEQALKDLSPVLNQINRQPNSLIFGGESAQEPEPKAKSN